MAVVLPKCPPDRVGPVLPGPLGFIGTGTVGTALATLLWAVEAVIAKRVLGSVPSSIVGAARLGVGLIILVAYLAVTGKLSAVASLQAQQWAWILITGGLLGGYVATWFGALQRAPASLVTAVLVLGAPVTATLQAIQLVILAAGLALALPAIRARSLGGAVAVPA